jgi:hypothetical protein
MSDTHAMSTHTVNGMRDLAMDDELGRYIGKQVEFIRFTRAGLAYVRAEDGKMLSIPRGNLDPKPSEDASTKLSL